MFSTLKTPPPIPVPRPELTPSVLDALMSEVPFITGAAPVRRNCIRLGIELGWGFCARPPRRLSRLCWFIPAMSGRHAPYSSWMTPTSSGTRRPVAFSQPRTLL